MPEDQPVRRHPIFKDPSNDLRMAIAISLAEAEGQPTPELRHYVAARWIVQYRLPASARPCIQADASIFRKGPGYGRG